MEFHFTGLVLGLVTFVIIGLFHPLVVKCYWWFGTRCWWWFLLAGISFAIGSVFVSSVLAQTILGVLAFSCFWTIREIFEQRERVRKGGFPDNPDRRK